MAAKNVGGRPPKYTCKEEIEEKIDAYFVERYTIFGGLSIIKIPPNHF